MTLDFIRSQTLQEDLLSVVNGDTSIQAYANSHILVTGATGLIGSLLIQLLLSYNTLQNTRIQVIAVVRDLGKAKEVFGGLYDREDLTFVEADLRRPFSYDGEVDYIFHTAAVTASGQMLKQPVDTIQASVYGTDHALQLAAEKQVRSFVYLSSEEVYGTFSKEKLVTEEELGPIDLKNVRSGYPESKRMCENLCAAYHRQYNVPVVIARLAQTFGAGIRSDESRVFAQFAGSVIRGDDIVLHTRGESVVNYCYTMDCLQALLLLGIKGTEGEAYNVVNDHDHCTVAEMAGMVAEKFGQDQCRVVFDVPDTDVYGYAPETKLVLSGKKMRTMGWQPQVGMEEGYRRLITYMKEMEIL